MATKKTWLFGSLAALIVAVSTGVLILQPGDEKNVVWCDVTGAAMIARGGLSSTAYTAYPFSENRTMGEPCINTSSNLKGAWHYTNITWSGCPSNSWAVDAEGARCRP